MKRYKVTQQFIDDLNNWQWYNSYKFEHAFNFSTLPKSVINYIFYDNKFHLEHFIDVLEYLENATKQEDNTLTPFIII